MRTGRLERMILFGLGFLYITWAGLYIFRSSYMAIDGQRYFGLFDDAMISMRYAWNLSHGLGLVWNPGERVEGYTNLLMTLVMSLFSSLLDKKLAVLAVQIFGILTMLGVAYLSWRLAREAGLDHPFRTITGPLIFGAVLAYYPLNHWSLLGMETGLLTFFIWACALFGLRWIRANRTGNLVGMALAAGLGFLTRNDSILLTAAIMAYVVLDDPAVRKDRLRRRRLFYAGLVLALFIAAQLGFRYIYYGELAPNTYTLKLAQFPIRTRLIGGLRFTEGFLAESWPMFALAGLGMLLRFRRMDILWLSPMLVALAYQVYIGGEPWDFWRITSSSVPGMLVLLGESAIRLVSHFRSVAAQRLAPAILMGTLILGPLIHADWRFVPYILELGPRGTTIPNRTHTNAAIAINALTLPGASVGVIWAGTLPYYVDRYAIDYLGKSDPYIAHLAADVSGDSGWGGMISVPGHNKYDLDYSIVQRRPTYSQAFAWGYATVKPFFVQNYVRVEYHGAAGTKTVFLLKDSPLVCWQTCQDQYRIIPWPK